MPAFYPGNECDLSRSPRHTCVLPTLPAAAAQGMKTYLPIQKVEKI